MKTVIIDNYDSFTYNLSHLVKELGAEVPYYVTMLSNWKNWKNSIKSFFHPVPVFHQKQACCSK